MKWHEIEGLSSVIITNIPIPKPSKKFATIVFAFSLCANGGALGRRIVLLTSHFVSIKSFCKVVFNIVSDYSDFDFMRKTIFGEISEKPREARFSVRRVFFADFLHRQAVCKSRSQFPRRGRDQ